MGLMREKRGKHSMLGRTAKKIIAEQIHRSLFGKGGYHWKEDAWELKQFLKEIKTTKLSKVINANTRAHVPKNVFRVGEASSQAVVH